MMRAILLIACFLSTGSARRVQNVRQECEARDWELKNSALQFNDAELGMVNLKQAMSDPALLADVARQLRQPEGRADLAKMLANPSFQQQMKDLIEANGAVADFLTPQYYAVERKNDDEASPDALAGLLLATNPSSAGAASSRARVRMDANSDLKALAKELNPVVGFYDPLGLAENEYWSQSNAATIGFLRHAEIKHGRVAMAGFVGYCLHENGIRWPWPLSTSLPDYSSFEGLSAPAVWDALPTASKLQIIGVIGFFEAWSETQSVLEADGTSHYMRGGKPGYFPTFKTAGSGGWVPHPVPLNLFDPFGLQKKLTEEQKADKLLIEINNGRLAMIGLMSLVAEAKAPGSVPALEGLVKQYEGDPMGPFSEKDTDLLFVKDMLENRWGKIALVEKWWPKDYYEMGPMGTGPVPMGFFGFNFPFDLFGNAR